MPVDPHYRPDPVYLTLGDEVADPVTPARFPKHVLRFRNQRWAQRVGLGALDQAEWEAAFARFQPLPDNLPRPLAMRYHGHQFQHYNPQLGDGRGFLFAQLRDAVNGRVLDLATKGSGTTPYSRGGDGRLTLKGGVREILAAELLEARGVPTSKAFSLFETGESLWRGDEPSPTRSSVLVRLGHSHLRFGTFQRHATHGRHDLVGRLVEHAIEHYLPEAQADPEAATMPPLAFLRAVVGRSAKLAARWMAAGFVHGVLNTDNMLVTGESFDYGPWRFLPRWDEGFTAAYFDHQGLYAYGRQPQAVLWNLARLAEALAGVLGDAPAMPILNEFAPVYRQAFVEAWLERLGVAPRGFEADRDLVEASLQLLAETQLPFDSLFHDWYGGRASEARAEASPVAAAYADPNAQPFREALREYEAAHPERLAEAVMQAPAPCSLLIDEVEAIWAPIADRDDWSLFEAKIAEIRAYGAVMGNAPAAPAT